MPQALPADQYEPLAELFPRELPGRAFLAYSMARALSGATWQRVLTELGVEASAEARVQRHRRHQRTVHGPAFDHLVRQLAQEWLSRPYLIDRRAVRRRLRAMATSVDCHPHLMTFWWEELGCGDLRERVKTRRGRGRLQHYRTFRDRLTPSDEKGLRARGMSLCRDMGPVYTRWEGLR